MSSCCTETSCEIDKLRDKQSKTLVVVLAVNCVMFVVEFSAGFIASSTALMADSLDMLGDAFVYGFSLYVVAKEDDWKARAAYAKSAVMFMFGVFVLFQVGTKLVYVEVPQYEIMGSIGILALVANSVCLYLLTRHREDDVNMRSVWLCSRNDIIANVSVLIAGAGVLLTASHWPDVLVGLGIAVLFIRSSMLVFKDAQSTMERYSCER
ncbi:MAG: cation transporter [bacterium]|nr:cation transporter [Gammaproteobacteria bacterium]HIL98331.1 cation transporter [Pseudomonadales bacterium]